MTAPGQDSAAPIEIAVLGPTAVRRDGVPVHLTPAQALLLLILLCAQGHAVPSATLQRRALDREPGPRAAQTVRRHLADLRHALRVSPPRRSAGSVIVTAKIGGRAGYRLDIEPDQVDACRYEQHVVAGCAASRAGHWAEAARQFGAAEELRRGEPLADAAGKPFAVDWVTRLDGWHHAAVTGLAEAHIRLGRYREAIPGLHAHTISDPGDRRGWQLLITALYAAGRDGDAARAARAAITTFRGQGLDPGQFRQLQHDVLSLAVPRDGSKALDAYPGSGSPPRTPPQPGPPAIFTPAAPALHSSARRSGHGRRHTAGREPDLNQEEHA